MLLRLIMICWASFSSCFFFFNDTATTEIYTLSLHDALPIYPHQPAAAPQDFRIGADPAVLAAAGWAVQPPAGGGKRDRKSTRLNSSHGYISYAVFCLKKKKRDAREPQ